MAIITFPSSPSVNQTYTVGSKTWIYNGYAWDLQLSSSGFSTANGTIAWNTANAAFTAANAATAADTTQNNSITAAFIAANSTGVYANGAFASANLRATTANASIAWNTANAAFVRANNSLDANNGGTVTGTITATAFITTGGNITGANTIYANNFVANTGFIQFSDGSRQFTANAGSGGGTTDQVARDTANAAFIKANTGTSGANSFGVIYTANNNTYANAATAAAQLNFVGESGVYVFANSITKTITVAGTPGAQGMTVDYGYVYEPTYYAVDYGTL